MAKKSTSPFVPGVGGTHTSKIMHTLSSNPSNLAMWVSPIRLILRHTLVSNHLFCLFLRSVKTPNVPITATPVPALSFLKQQTVPVPPPVPPATTTIPHQPAYRAPTDRIFYLPHTCQPACLKRVRPVRQDFHRGKNPLLTPLLYDFRRMTGRRKVNRKVKYQPRWTEV